MKCSGLILAGGSGQRAGEMKQFTQLGSLTACQRVEQAMSDTDVFDEIIIVTPEIGGNTRIESMYEGVKLCSGEFVIVTDASRVYTPSWVFKKMYSMLSDIPVAVLQPEYDSIVRAENMVWGNYPRGIVRRTQTPNGFKRELLETMLVDMIRQDNLTHSALSWYIQQYGQPNFMVDEFFNPKITTKADIQHAMEYFSGKEANK